MASRSASTRALPAWHNLTLTDGWTYGACGSYHAAYYKDPEGVVHLKGSASNGDSFQVVFRLPSGARPSHSIYLPVYASDGSPGGMEIDPDGRAHLYDTSGDANVKMYTSLDGISFRAP